MFSKKIAAKKLPMKKRSGATLPPVWERAMNAEQLEGINHHEGPCRLLAAAGSGKTRVVVHRIMRLVFGAGIAAARILAVTFSKKAADEMNVRLAELGVAGARVGTWHSLCLQILKEPGSPWRNWKVDGDDDKPTRAKYILKDVVGFKDMKWNGADLNALERFISVCKASLFTPDSAEAYALATKMLGNAVAATKAVEAFSKYNDALAEQQLLTFDDFLVFVAEYLRSDEQVRCSWAGRWEFLIQDEYQDTNLAQKVIAELLARDHRNYMAVGDVFQAIYSFRGSTPEYLANFDQEWPGAVTIWLGTNYRSGRAIINAANGIVRSARVPGYEPRDMVAGRDFEGSVRTMAGTTLDDEAQNFIGWANGLLTSGARPSDITVLYRTNAQSRAIEEALLGARVPYTVVGGTSFYARKEVRDLLAYLRVATGLGESDDVKRCINTPYRFLGNAFVERVMRVADRTKEKNWTKIVTEAASEAGLQARQTASAPEWVRIIEQVADVVRVGAMPGAHETAKNAAKPSNVLEAIIRATKYIDFINREEGSESIENSGAANVREMVRVAERFGTVRELLKYVDDTVKAASSQRRDKQAGGERVLLMSVHRSKGLEWPHVWIAGFNEMILPHMRGEPEEERRLAYVAATRARDTLVLSYVLQLATRAGIKDAEPSRFLLDSGVRLDGPSDDDFAVGIVGETDALPELAPLP